MVLDWDVQFQERPLSCPLNGGALEFFASAVFYFEKAQKSPCTGLGWEIIGPI